MRSALRILPILLLLAASAAAHADPQPVPPPPSLEATAWILVDHQSGQPLVSYRANEPIEPASITKLMTAYAVFHALREGKLKLDTLVPISEHAWRSEGSRTYLDLNSRVPVEVLIQGMIVQSGNDATIALAEAVAGTEGTFAALMNQYAERLGMTHSHFQNATGWPGDNHKMSAARHRAAHAGDHPRVPGVLPLVLAARIHLEQHPAAEPERPAGP